MDYDETATTRFGSSQKYAGVDMKGDKGTASAVNVKIIRLSEIYLLAAEAALKLPAPDFLIPVALCFMLCALSAIA